MNKITATKPPSSSPAQVHPFLKSESYCSIPSPEAPTGTNRFKLRFSPRSSATPPESTENPLLAARTPSTSPATDEGVWKMVWLTGWLTALQKVICWIVKKTHFFVKINQLIVFQCYFQKIPSFEPQFIPLEIEQQTVSFDNNLFLIKFVDNERCSKLIYLSLKVIK